MSSTQVAVIAQETSSQTDFGGAGDKFHEEMFSKKKVAQSHECFSSKLHLHDELLSYLHHYFISGNENDEEIKLSRVQ